MQIGASGEKAANSAKRRTLVEVGFLRCPRFLDSRKPRCLWRLVSHFAHFLTDSEELSSGFFKSKYHFIYLLIIFRCSVWPGVFGETDLPSRLYRRHAAKRLDG